MTKKRKTTRLELKKRKIRQLDDREVKQARGGLPGDGDFDSIRLTTHDQE